MMLADGDPGAGRPAGKRDPNRAVQGMAFSGLVWLALWMLAGCADGRVRAPATPPAAPAANQIRVMSYNVNFALAGSPTGIEAIASAGPDVVFLQETSAGWERALVERLGARYPHRRFEPPMNDWMAGGMGVLSRYPIVEIQTLVAPDALFFAWRVVLDSAVGRIQVFNLHLRPPISDDGSWVVGYFSTRADRLREIQHYFEALDSQLPALFVGDFNEEGDGRAIEWLEERGYADAIARFEGNRRTWEWQVGSVTLRYQLDHILHDTQLVPVAAAIVEAGRSDHRPVWADFERRER